MTMKRIHTNPGSRRAGINGLLVCLTISGIGMAFAEPVDETRPASAEGRVVIDVERGDVRVAGWERATVQVVGWIDDGAQEFIFDSTDEKTEILVRMPESWYRRTGGRATDIDVNVPHGSSVALEGVSTDLSVADIVGRVKAASVSGDVDVQRIEDDVFLSTVSGVIRFREVAGDLRAVSVSGDVGGHGFGGSAEVESVSGDIRVEEGGSELIAGSVSGRIIAGLADIAEARCDSVSGDIEISGSLAADAYIEMETVSGDMRLRLGRLDNVLVDLESGGDIRNRLTAHKPRKSKYSNERHLRFTVGDADASIVAETMSGRITIE